MTYCIPVEVLHCKACGTRVFGIAQPAAKRSKLLTGACHGPKQLTLDLVIDVVLTEKELAQYQRMGGK